MTMNRLLVALALLSSAASAQGANSACGSPPAAPTVAARNALRRLSADEVKQLRYALCERRWADALAIYPNDAPLELPVWLIYIDGSGKIVEQVVGADRDNDKVHGKPRIWTVVFSDRPMDAGSGRQTRLQHLVSDTVVKHREWSALQPGSAPPPDVAKLEAAEMALQKSRADLAAANAAAGSDDLSLGRFTIVKPKNPLLVRLAEGLAKGFTFTPTQTTTPVASDTARPISLAQVAEEASAEKIWVGHARLALPEYAQIELSIRSASGKVFPKPAAPPTIDVVRTSVYNRKTPSWEFGFLAARTHGRDVPKYDATLRLTGVSDVRENSGYAALFSNWRWFDHPLRKNPLHVISFGGFAATSVTGTLLERWALGLSAGHLIWDLGFSAGLAWVPTTVLRGSSTDTDRLTRWLLGFDFRL